MGEEEEEEEEGLVRIDALFHIVRTNRLSWRDGGMEGVLGGITC